MPKSKKIPAIKLQKAILFARIKEEAEKSSTFGGIKDKLNELSNKLNLDNKIISEMKSKGYSAIKVQYNPETIHISSNAEISDDEDGAGTKGKESGNVALTSGNQLSLQLIFEAVDKDKKDNNVKDVTECLVALMVSDMTRKVVFHYGGILFSGELISVNVQYKMFDRDGNPIWAVVSISMQELEEDTQKNESDSAKSNLVQTDREYESIEREYDNFSNPVAIIKINGKDISENKSQLSVSDLEVELTSGYEASIATFCIYNSFDKDKSSFKTDDLKRYVMLGSSVSISTGYGSVAKNIFRGFIAKTDYTYSSGEQPHVELTCMDIKGIMMSGSYAKQLMANNYSDAVSEIFQKAVYTRMQSEEIITKLSISDTPDKTGSINNSGSESGQGVTDKSIEMVNESDYEFVVRAAKKFNYEFFVDSGNVIFRKSKENVSKIMDLKLDELIKKFNVEYDMSGLVETIHVRGMDTGKMKLIKSKRKWNNKISQGNKAKQLIKKSEKIYIDSTVRNQQDADFRSEYLIEDMSYRFGTLTCECKGLPDLKPGITVGIKGLGIPVDNEFYITEVKHIFNSESEYTSSITGKAKTL